MQCVEAVGLPPFQVLCLLASCGNACRRAAARGLGHLTTQEVHEYCISWTLVGGGFASRMGKSIIVRWSIFPPFFAHPFFPSFSLATPPLPGNFLAKNALFPAPQSCSFGKEKHTHTQSATHTHTHTHARALFLNFLTGCPADIPDPDARMPRGQEVSPLRWGRNSTFAFWCEHPHLWCESPCPGLTTDLIPRKFGSRSVGGPLYWNPTAHANHGEPSNGTLPPRFHWLCACPHKPFIRIPIRPPTPTSDDSIWFWVGEVNSS